MQVNITLDTTSAGDINALQQMANAFNGSQPQPTAAPAPAAPKADKTPAKPKDDAQALNALPDNERITIEQMRAVAVTKVGKDVKALLTELDQPSVSEMVDDPAIRATFLERVKLLKDK